MTEHEEERIGRFLKQSLAPVKTELSQDLWPRMQRRQAEHANSRNWLAALFSPERLAAVPWFDWMSLAAVILGICFFPKSIPIWLYHL